MGIITRQGKGSKLTSGDMDGNLEYLDAKVPKTYKALLTQEVGVVTTIILSNTLGFNIDWVKLEAGVVIGEDKITGFPFDPSKTFMNLGLNMIDQNYKINIVGGKILISTYNKSVSTDDMLKNTPITIEIYE